MDIKLRAKKILVILCKTYPNAKIPLTHKNPLQLLVATILSAQCTDERVNMVTPALFAKYKTAKDFANASRSDIEKLVHSTGFYKAKSKNIINCCKTLVQNHNGEVPNTLDELVKLAGVGRKTANVILSGVWDIPGVVVDTHVKRLSYLMGFTKNTDPEKIEQDIMKLLPEKDWNDLSISIIFHGRNICIARRPKCLECPITKLCPKTGLKVNY